MIASNARSGPVPLPLEAGSVPPIYTKGDTLYYTTDVVAGAPRERSCARREALERMELSRCARGEGLIASNARSGPVPLLLPLREVSGAGLWKKGVG